MAEYIEREAAREAMLPLTNGNPVLWSNIKRAISAITAADVVPVVRCKDCKYRQDDDFCGGRGWPAQLVSDDGYCDRGVRKDGDA